MPRPVNGLQQFPDPWYGKSLKLFFENNYHHYKTGCYVEPKEFTRDWLLISIVINILYCIFLKLQTIYISASPSLFFNLTVKKSLHARSRSNFEDQNKGYIATESLVSFLIKCLIWARTLQWFVENLIILWLFRTNYQNCFPASSICITLDERGTIPSSSRLPTCFLQSFWVII